MIKVEKPTDQILEELDVLSWPIWEKEESEFPWEYDMEEICYILSGEATITPQDGDPVKIGPGDLVFFTCGMKCVWRIHSTIRKHYDFR